MLSLPKKMGSPSQGATYFEKDSYYLDSDNRGEWYGKSAAVLGLCGAIDRQEFLQILKGATTKNEGLLKNSFDENRNAYLDCTFSAPKSVSILSYVDKQLESCHNSAIKNVLDEIEKRYSVSRKGAQGETKEVTENLLFAKFNHHENRNLDPQLHSHCLVMNLSLGNDNKWRTIDDHEIFTNKMFLGLLYRTELAKEVQKYGYKIEITDREKGLFEIAGVDKKILKEFSSRRKEILENLHKYEDYNCGEAQKKEYACLDSRDRKRQSEIPLIRDEIQLKLSEHDMSLEKIRELAQASSALNHDMKSVSSEECIALVLSDLTENESAFRREDAIRHAMKIGLGVHSFRELERAFDTHKDLVRLGNKTVEMSVNFGGEKELTTYKKVELYSTYEMQQIEKDILTKALEGRNTSELYSKKKVVETYLKKIEGEGIELSKGQAEAVRKLSLSKDRLNILQGDAGSGKTYAVEHINNIFRDQGIVVRGFAPTGKAADELAGAKIETQTVDAFLEKVSYGKSDAGKGEIWIVDESSMMGSKKMLQFLKEAEKADSKVVLIGDTKQLQSVSAGKIFEDLQKFSGVTYCEITENRRQENRDMQSLVTAIKEKKVLRAFGQLEELGKVREVSNANERFSMVADEYCHDRKEMVDAIVITGSNKERQSLNTVIRDRLVESGSVDHGEEFVVYSSAGLSGTSRTLADSYKEGQAVFVQKSFDGFEKGVEAKIKAVEAQANTITVQYWDKEKKRYEKAVIDVLKHGNKVQPFNVEKKRFGCNDEVLFLKNDKQLGVKNGQLGRVASIDRDGNAQIIIGKGKKQKEVSCNLSNQGSRAYNYIDHGYALTSYKSQGATVDKAIVCNDSSVRTNMNDLYVSMTRAKYDVSVYSNDLSKMRKQALVEQEKHSTLDYSRYSEAYLTGSPVVEKTVEKKGLEISQEAIDKERQRAKDALRSNVIEKGFDQGKVIDIGKNEIEKSKDLEMGMDI